MNLRVVTLFSTTSQLFFKDEVAVANILLSEARRVVDNHDPYSRSEPCLLSKLSLRLTGLLASQINSHLVCQVTAEGPAHLQARIYVKGTDDLGTVTPSQLH